MRDLSIESSIKSQWELFSSIIIETQKYVSVDVKDNEENPMSISQILNIEIKIITMILLSQYEKIDDSQIEYVNGLFSSDLTIDEINEVAKKHSYYNDNPMMITKILVGMEEQLKSNNSSYAKYLLNFLDLHFKYLIRICDYNENVEIKAEKIIEVNKALWKKDVIESSDKINRLYKELADVYKKIINTLKGVDELISKVGESVSANVSDISENLFIISVLVVKYLSSDENNSESNIQFLKSVMDLNSSDKINEVYFSSKTLDINHIPELIKDICYIESEIKRKGILKENSTLFDMPLNHIVEWLKFISKMYGNVFNTSASKMSRFNVFTNDIEKYICNRAKTNSERIYFDISSKNKEGKTTEEKTIEGLVEDEAFADLNALIGLKSIKSEIRELIYVTKMNNLRQQKGLKTIPITHHLVFTGNPGTGKTTVARILAKLYKEIGILEKGQLIEVDRSGLVAGYVGQTAIKTQEKINEAIGGVLFIDEAYSLAKGENDFGQEAIDTLLKAMEDYRSNLVVIVAGYRDLMEKFINSNPGLKSRFNKYIDFEDYSASELIEIFISLCNKYEYKVTDAAMEKIKSKINDIVEHKDSTFANARDIRNYFENIITKQAARLFEHEDEGMDLSLITIEDVESLKI